MTKAFLILISGVLSASAFAAEGPAAGRTVLKLEDNPVRSAAVAISALDKEIAKVEQEIVDNRNQAASYKALPNNGLRSAQLDTVTAGLEVQRDELLRERASLQNEIVRSAE